MTNRSLALLSGEGTTIPAAEARALFRAYDPDSRLVSAEPRVIITESKADPFTVGSRAAFSRRVGVYFDGLQSAVDFVGARRVRLRVFDLVQGLRPLDPSNYLHGTNISVSLSDPELELTLVRGEREYLAVTAPASMRQGWSKRRPRVRAFFHPAAIFPKLSRAMVNLSRCLEGETFFDPFCGTGSLALEAHLVGAHVVAADRSAKMCAGSLANMRLFDQSWLGIVRSDSMHTPVRKVDAVATDVPYGRASSTGGRRRDDMVDDTLSTIPGSMARGSRLVIMHSKQSRVFSTRDLDLEEEHDLYVHKLLTRTISVLRRR